MVAAIKRMESGVWQPGFIKVDVFHITIKHVFHRLGVVQNAVVGGLRQGQHAGLDLADIQVW